jgi:hypothetical protein
MIKFRGAVDSYKQSNILCALSSPHARKVLIVENRSNNRLCYSAHSHKFVIVKF